MTNPSTAHLLLIVVVSLLLISCASPERQLTLAELNRGYESYAHNYQNELLKIASKSAIRLEQEYLASPQQSYDILVLSGGGAFGAFGAGFLEAWGEVTKPGYSRPVFDSVSGISTGALIAPFAFIGTHQAYDKLVDIYRNPDDDLIVPNTILAFLAGNSAYYDASRLHEQIRDTITIDLISELSKGAEANRVLLVGATNLDYGLMRVWDLAEIAKNVEVVDAHKDITERLIASSAIPSAFPPVNINKNLYVDGGASMQVVSGLEDRQWLYNSSPQNLEFVVPQKPLRVRIWVVINNKLMMEPQVTKQSWATIATRSLMSLMYGSTLQTLQDVETFSQMINKLPQFDVQMHYVAIPQDFNIPDSTHMFDKNKMRALVELGREMGSDYTRWTQRALRPGAPLIGIKSN